MDGLKSWALAVCAAAVAGGLVQLLAPNPSSGRILKVVVSIFFLCVLISPLLGGVSLDMDFSVLDYQPEQTQEIAQRLEDSMDSMVINNATEQLKQAITSCLSAYQVENGKITIIVNTNENGSISINEIEIILPKQYESQHQELVLALQNELGLTPKIQYDSEDEING